jgi:uncharacterized protein (DUF1778 family)
VTGQTRSEIIPVRVTPHEKALISAVAVHLRQPRSQYLREVALDLAQLLLTQEPDDE